MATYELPTVHNSVEYENGGNVQKWRITKVTDGKSGSVLNVGDTVTISWLNSSGNAGKPFDAEFIGTMTVTVSGNAQVFMVLERVREIGGDTYTYHYVVGLTNTNAPSTFNKSANVTEESFTVCFFPGTLIATPFGELKVEELVSGDLVLVGETSVVPVKWIGRQTVSTLFGPAERLMPVRFAAGSLGGGGGQFLLPQSDLTVTPDHAMHVDGILCEAGALVNGTTITRVPLSEFGESYTVYHVETEAHEIILANGAPAETFVDNASRRAFDNFTEFEALHGNPPEMKELPYPRASNARHLPARIKNRLGIGVAQELGKVA